MAENLKLKNIGATRRGSTSATHLDHNGLTIQIGSYEEITVQNTKTRLVHVITHDGIKTPRKPNKLDQAAIAQEQKTLDEFFKQAQALLARRRSERSK